MQNDPTMTYFEMLGSVEQELGPAKHYKGDKGGVFCTWYADYDTCKGIVCQVFGTYEPDNQDQIKDVRVLIDMRSPYAVDLIWQAGRNNVVLTTEVPPWAQGKIASVESFEGHEAMEEIRHQRQQSTEG